MLGSTPAATEAAEACRTGLTPRARLQT